MNFFDGTFQRDGQSAWVEVTGGIRFPVDPLVRGTEGQAVIYGIRPGHLHLVTSGDGGVPAEVQVIEPTGDDTLVFCRIGSVDACAGFVERHAFRPGETIRLAPKPANGHVFDAVSGRRV